jgi:hypothetical protein
MEENENALNFYKKKTIRCVRSSYITDIPVYLGCDLTQQYTVTIKETVKEELSFALIIIMNGLPS